MPNDYNQVIYYAKSFTYAERRLTLLRDADVLSALCHDTCTDWEEYILFTRCMAEQTIVDGPSDPDATFRGKAGEEHRGYVANLEESVGENGSVITDYQFEQNTYSDSQFLHDSLEKVDTQEETVIIATDGAYPTPEKKGLPRAKMFRLYQQT